MCAPVCIALCRQGNKDESNGDAHMHILAKSAVSAISALCKILDILFYIIALYNMKQRIYSLHMRQVSKQTEQSACELALKPKYYDDMLIETNRC